MSRKPPAGPVTRLTRNGRYRWLRSGWIVVACFSLAVAVHQLARLPTTAATPNGLELELPGTSDGALAVMRALEDARNPDNTDPHNLDRAARAIYWDFVLIFGYATGFATLLEWLAAKDPAKADALMTYAAWGALAAGCADVFENTAMLIMLADYRHNPRADLGLPALFGTVASLAKWTVLFAVLGYSGWEIAKRIVQLFKRKHSDGTPTPEPKPQPPAPAETHNPYEEEVFSPGERLRGKKEVTEEEGEVLPM